MICDHLLLQFLHAPCVQGIHCIQLPLSDFLVTLCMLLAIIMKEIIMFPIIVSICMLHVDYMCIKNTW